MYILSWSAGFLLPMFAGSKLNFDLHIFSSPIGYLLLPLFITLMASKLKKSVLVKSLQNPFALLSVYTLACLCLLPIDNSTIYVNFLVSCVIATFVFCTFFIAFSNTNERVAILQGARASAFVILIITLTEVLAIKDFSLAKDLQLFLEKYFYNVPHYLDVDTGTIRHQPRVRGLSMEANFFIPSIILWVALAPEINRKSYYFAVFCMLAFASFWGSKVAIPLLIILFVSTAITNFDRRFFKSIFWISTALLGMVTIMILKWYLEFSADSIPHYENSMMSRYCSAETIFSTSFAAGGFPSVNLLNTGVRALSPEACLHSWVYREIHTLAHIPTFSLLTKIVAHGGIILSVLFFFSVLRIVGPFLNTSRRNWNVTSFFGVIFILLTTDPIVNYPLIATLAYFSSQSMKTLPNKVQWKRDINHRGVKPTTN